MPTPAVPKLSLVSPKEQEHTFMIAFLLTAPFIGYALHLIHLPMGDFSTIFYKAAQIPLEPYSVPGFINPPWAALLIAPFSFIPAEPSRILISLLNMFITSLLVLRYGGGRFALLVTLTSYPFLFLLSTGSVEWLPMLGLLVQRPFLMLAKPQSGALVLLVWFKRQQGRLAFASYIAAFLGLSSLIWWGWPQLMLDNIRTLPATLASPLNKINLWPWGIPIGFVALYYAWVREDELPAILATWLLVPHIVYHSLTMGMALLATRNPRLALAVSITLYVIAALRWRFA